MEGRHAAECLQLHVIRVHDWLQGAVEFLQDETARASKGTQEHQLDVCRQTARVSNFGADGVKSVEDVSCTDVDEAFSSDAYQTIGQSCYSPLASCCLLQGPEA